MSAKPAHGLGGIFLGWTGAQSEIELSSTMTKASASGFNAIAGALVDKEKKALVS